MIGLHLIYVTENSLSGTHSDYQTITFGVPQGSVLGPLVLKNRFHVAVRLFSNRSQMTKCGKNKNVAHGAIAECVTDES